NCIQQGITTVITGNCGFSAAPITGSAAKVLTEDFGKTIAKNDVAGFLEQLGKIRISTNLALLIGHGNLRASAVGMTNQSLTSDRLEDIVKILEKGMEQGAFGVSLGLEYAPGIFAPSNELVSLGQVVSRQGGLITSHIRNEGPGLPEAITEMLDIGRKADVRVQISHLKAVGPENWANQELALDLIETAQKAGVDVFADAYPYTVSNSTLTLFLESWAREGGSVGLLKRMNDSKMRARISREADIRVKKSYGDYDSIIISRVLSPANRNYVGKSLLKIANMRGKEPLDVLMALLETEGFSGEYFGQAMSQDNVEYVLSHPLVMIGSDGNCLPSTEKIFSVHPRSFGTYPRVLGYYVRERKIMDLPVAIRKMTSMPAERLGLKDRGRIALGMKADIVIFNAGEIWDEAVFDAPSRPPKGIERVMVNGQWVYENGNHTGKRPGSLLRKN
ncbi:MAG: amidohydrolase family protein, partial [Desulfobacterales bacterium]|nr:amidohydrolase family protein [Desulfobacterales bacterium]